MKEKSDNMSALENSATLSGAHLPGSDASKVPVYTSVTRGSTQTASSGTTLAQKNHSEKEQETEAHYRSSGSLPQGVASTMDPTVQSIMVSAVNTGTAAPSKTNCSPLVSHMSAMSLMEGSEAKRMGSKIELSPGGPPVNSSTSNNPPGRDTEQLSLCAVMQQTFLSLSVQNVELDTGSIKREIDASLPTKQDLKHEVPENLAVGSSESSVT